VARLDDEEGRAPWDAWDWLTGLCFAALGAWCGHAFGYVDGVVDTVDAVNAAPVSPSQDRGLSQLQRQALTPPFEARPLPLGEQRP